MEVRGIHAAVVAHAGDEFVALHELAHVDAEIEQVAVKRIDVFRLAVLEIRAADDDDVAPAEPVVFGKGDDAIGCGINRVAEIGVAAADAVPIFA